jgi:hypothetical protein
LQNPRCSAGEAFGPYGRFDGGTSAAKGTGQVCVRPWKRGADNGGATSPGVARTAIRVVAIVPNESQARVLALRGAGPKNRADDSTGTVADAVHDLLLAEMPFYETWGRNVEVRFVTSSGDDEAAQRADAVTIKAIAPFAALDFTVGLPVLEAELAKARIVVFGFASTTSNALAQVPYRWGPSDTGAVAVNAAEVIGKQLVGRHARFAGAELQQRRRRFAAVFVRGSDETQRFERALARWHGTVTSKHGYDAPGSPTGDPTTASEQAPVLVTRMKEAGVTTVVLFSDAAMNRALMQQATAQDWQPEWFLTGALFQEIAVLARTYPTEQAAHAFGISNLAPSPPTVDPERDLLDPLNWYWGRGVGTSGGTIGTALIWLLGGIQAAGPDLTPRTFRQGWFSVPARGGAAESAPICCMTGFGRTAGLPYDSYGVAGVDFAPVWWDGETRGRSQWPLTMEGSGVAQYVDGGNRYAAGTWPRTVFRWFDRSQSIFQFDARPVPQHQYVGDCRTCPSHGGAGTPGARAHEGFLAMAYGNGEAAL